MERRIKLEEPVIPRASLTHRCALCLAWLFETDNYCPNCGKRVRDEVVIGVVKGVVPDTSEDDWNKPMEEPI